MKNLILIIIAVSLFGCSDHFTGPGIQIHETGAAISATSIPGNTTAQAGPTAAVSGGASPVGAAVPTAEATVARITNGLEGKVSPTQGNFRNALNNVRTNLPKVRNVNDASGFDAIQLVAYAACADLTTGGTPLMQSDYGVTLVGTVAANQAALIAAGMRILDQHTAGLASRGPASAQLTTIYTNLVQAQATAGATSKMAFMAVCIAASTAGSTLLGM
jgi:hypothetical protein